jgi:F0F1-type ATP synthase assembly protein I
LCDILSKEGDKKYLRLIRSKDSKALKELSPFLIMGWQMVLTIVLCGILGWWLDKQFNTKPWLLIGFLFFGVFAAMVSFLKTAMNANKKKNTKE